MTEGRNPMERINEPAPLPARPAEGHKGMFGRVLVAVPRSILPYALSITPELIGLGLGKSAGKDQLLEAGEQADAIVIGPGLGRTPEAMARVQRLVRLEKPMVIDADGLNLLSDFKRWPTYFKAKAVLTPHPGEMARLGKLIGRTEVPK